MSDLTRVVPLDLVRSMSVELPITTPVAFACPRRKRTWGSGHRRRCCRPDPGSGLIMPAPNCGLG